MAIGRRHGTGRARRKGWFFFRAERGIGSGNCQHWGARTGLIKLAERKPARGKENFATTTMVGDVGVRLRVLTPERSVAGAFRCHFWNLGVPWWWLGCAGCCRVDCGHGGDWVEDAENKEFEEGAACCGSEEGGRGRVVGGRGGGEARDPQWGRTREEEEDRGDAG